MSDAPLGRYHFLSWARRGIGASVNTPIDSGALPDRVSLDVQLSLSVQQGSATNVQPVSRAVEMFGPGDVIGIDPRHIIRTEPRNFTVNFEPNYLCGIEFDTPDLPWLFTPAAPNGNKLRPWLTLIALKPDEFTLPSIAPNPLPVVNILSAAGLKYDLADSWNWAHVQVSGDDSLTDSMTSAPGNVLSRLICPRRLDPETHYTVFLVPAFDIGVKAGVGQDVSGIHTSGPAWTAQTAVPFTMPFYYQFEFNTSDEGDFESLVRRLSPRVLTADVGIRDMDVSVPAPEIPSAGPLPLGLQGALQSVLTKPTDWTDPGKTNFQSAVQTFINTDDVPVLDLANPGADPVIAPPIYGRWHAAVQSVDRTAAGWVNDLNLDPRNRSGAGMGTEVVQDERTQLMASAWQQVDGIRQANEVLRQAQLARAALQQIHRNRLMPTQAETMLAVTAPLHAKLLASPRTIRATVRSSLVPERMLSGAFRRVTRPRRRIGTSPNTRATLLNRVNSGQVAVVPAPKPPDGTVSLEQLAGNIAPGWLQKLAQNNLLFIFILLVLFFIVLGLAAAIGGAIVAAGAVVVMAIAAALLFPVIKGALQRAQEATELTMAGFTPQEIAKVPANANFVVTQPGTAPPAAGATGLDSAQAVAFRSATSDLFTAIQSFPVDAAIAPALNTTVLKTTLLARLDPVFTVPRRVQSLLIFSARFSWQAPDVLEPIMAAPDFPQPMYAPLRDLSPEYVLPGVENVLPDTVGILLSNHAFIESYMVGLNHEMSRQLLWNDYPTDQRGSYFRQFWDVSAYVPQAGDPADPAALTELLKDIPPIHTWPKPVPLGDHPNRTDVPLNNVVLLVRGELFKRYPNAIVFAGKAKRDDKGNRILDETDERYPIFRGTLPNDITFLGFNLSQDDARGGTNKAPDGFFFVFQQQPSEPRFGLEPTSDSTVTHWANLAWTNFGGGQNNAGSIFKLPSLGNTVRGKTIAASPWRLASQVFSIVKANVQLPDFLAPGLAPSGVSLTTAPTPDGDYDPDDINNKWGVNSAQTAYILLRLPYRILIHADLMLPPKS